MPPATRSQEYAAERSLTPPAATAAQAGVTSPVLVSVPDHRRDAGRFNSVLIGGTPALAVQAWHGGAPGVGAVAGHLARQRAT